MPPLLLAVSRPTALVLAEADRSGPQRLTPPERKRMDRLRRSGDRDDFLAAHLLVRECAARVLGVHPESVSIVQRCATCGGPHGRPEVVGQPGLGASLAHSRGVVAAAAATVPVGVDVEAFPPGNSLVPDDLSAVLTGAEMSAIDAAADPQRAVLLAWARKEACLKAGLVDVDGLSGFDLSALALDPPGGDLAPRSERYGDWGVHDWWDRRAGAIGVVVAPAEARLTLAGA